MLCHAHFHTLQTPLPPAGLPQQLGCARAEVLSELARQVFPLQGKPSRFCQSYLESTGIIHMHQDPDSSALSTELADHRQSDWDETESQTKPPFILSGPKCWSQRRWAQKTSRPVWGSQRSQWCNRKKTQRPNWSKLASYGETAP